jgi:hypothetical protein
MADAQTPATRSYLMASLLKGAWRAEPSATDSSAEELKLILPLLIETGAGALAWRRIRNSPLEATHAALQLQDTYRLYKLRAIIYEREVAEIFKLLRSHRIEPVLVKGWAAARHYAEPETRPCGDVDLCVRKAEFLKAQALLDERRRIAHNVDLHEEFQYLDGAGFDELSSRSELLSIEHEEVRVLSPEDHLRVVCYHFLREGGWRPLWLCDIASALESRPAQFDWDLCLKGTSTEANWVACAIKLSQTLLGANVTDVPASVRDVKLPRWLLPGIVREWETRSMSQRHRAPMSALFTRPVYTLKGLPHHWPTPVEATVTMGHSFNERPRLPLQLRSCVRRAARLLVRLPRILRRQKPGAMRWKLS